MWPIIAAIIKKKIADKVIEKVSRFGVNVGEKRTEYDAEAGNDVTITRPASFSFQNAISNRFNQSPVGNVINYAQQAAGQNADAKKMLELVTQNSDFKRLIQDFSKQYGQQEGQ